MVKLFWGILLSITLSIPCLGQNAGDKNKIEAKRLWEQVVQAHGGRSKLESVSNLLVTSGYNSDNIQIEFYVFPQRYWDWHKDKGFHDFMMVRTKNLDSGNLWVTGYSGIVTLERLSPAADDAEYREGWLIEACAFLLETKWARPTPVRIRSERVGKERLDVIETVFDGFTTYKTWGLDYYVDPESLEIKHVAWKIGESQPWHVYHFGPSVVVNGITVPSTFGVSSASVKSDQWSKSPMIPISFQFNVDYNPQLFVVPPSVAAGPDAWKPKP